MEYLHMAIFAAIAQSLVFQEVTIVEILSTQCLETRELLSPQELTRVRGPPLLFVQNRSLKKKIK